MTGNEYSEDASVSPEVLYKHYRETRLSHHERQRNRVVRIDAIMAQLEEQRSGNSDITHPLPKIHSVSTGTSVVKLPMRVAVIAVAATLAAILIIPDFIGVNDYKDSVEMTVAAVPDSLMLASERLMPFIDQSNNSALGFSSGASMTIRAFKRGILATDLALAGNANRNDTIVEILQTPWLQALSSSTVEPTDSALAKAGADYVSKWDGLAAADADSSMQLDEILHLLHPSTADASLREWFLQGQSIEAVRIAADLALEQSSTTPLLEALALQKTLPLPTETLPGSGLIGSLRDRSLSESLTVDDIRWVLATTENILAVMQ